VAALFKAWVCSRSLAGIVGSNSAGDMDVCVFWVLCVVRQRSLQRADHSSREGPPTALRRCMRSRNLTIEEAIDRVGSQRQTGGRKGGRKNLMFHNSTLFKETPWQRT
jgi:hypothetical protein